MKLPDRPTSETKITAQLLLRTYQLIIDNGKRSETGYEYMAVTATADADGYSVALTDGVVTARVLFHNKIALDTPSRRALANFRKRIKTIEKAPMGKL